MAAPATAVPQLGFHLAQGDARHAAAARAAGAGFGVVVFAWDTIEPEPGRLYWEIPDAALRAAEFHGLELVARLDRPPEWAFDDSSPSPWNLDAYAAFVQKVLDRYGERLAGVILWNEPNLSLEWDNQLPDPAGYVALLARGYTAAKLAAPEVPVLLAGLAFTRPTTPAAVNDLEYLQAIYDAGGADFFDILAAHPYGFGQPPDAAPATGRLNFRRLELHREIMDTNGDRHKPIWITEMGWRTSAPDPVDSWQVVSPQRQKDYVMAVLARASRYPWLERLALWELNARGDDYGYYLWHGPGELSQTYTALVESCEQLNPDCTVPPSDTSKQAGPVEVLAPDVIIRLGDRDTLHPHWVHLYQNGQNFSPDWQGEFFLSRQQASRDFDLILETMQVDQPTNRLFINGSELATIQTRTRPDQTSTWVSQRFRLPASLLAAGVNTLQVTSGLRNPARQYAFWRWENFQFRDIRLVPARPAVQPWLTNWQAQPAPGGWVETNRLRAGPAGDFWLTGNRPGQIWESTAGTGQAAHLRNRAADRPDLVFTDVLPLDTGRLAATDRGLFWQKTGTQSWTAVSDAPTTFAYVVAGWQERYYAGFEAAGLWSAARPAGPWRPVSLPGKFTILDILATPDALYLATSDGVFARSGQASSWQRLPELPGGDDNSLKRFVTRLFTGREDELLLRNLDQLWRFDPVEGWQPFGPPALHETNKVTAVLDCCGPGAVAGTSYAGLWQLAESGSWQPRAGEVFDRTDVVDFLRSRDDIYAAGIVALLQSADGGETWRKVEGLPPAVSDLLPDPTDPNRWLASTPAGVYRSSDGGQNWQPVSPPWTVWDMAYGPDGRLFVARTAGLAWTDDTGAATINWRESDGLNDVLFFNVTPHPSRSQLVAGGTWGNNLGVSRDGGQTIASIHNGLETLSVLSVVWHTTPGQLTIGTIEGLYRTDDAGGSWFKLPGPLHQQTVYALLQTGDGTIWAGAADGLWFSQDYGVSWQQAPNLSGVTILRLGQVTAAGQSWLWAGTEGAGLWLSGDNGTSWQLAGLSDLSIYNLFNHPAEPDLLVVAANEGIFTATLSD